MTRTRTTRSLLRAFAVAAVLAGAAQPGAAEEVVAKEFHGDWVPAQATCESPTRFRVTGDSFTLINGKDSQSYGDISIATSFYGPDYNGISVAAFPEIDTDEPPLAGRFPALNNALLEPCGPKG